MPRTERLRINDNPEQETRLTQKWDTPQWVVQETQEKLSQQEMQLTDSSLEKLWKSRSEALKLAKKVLNINDPLDFEVFKNRIEKYQEKHNIWVDWKIWKETFVEMEIEWLKEQVIKNINTIWISSNSIKKIEYALENANPIWKNIRETLIVVEWFKQNSPLAWDNKYKELFEKLEKFKTNPSNLSRAQDLVDKNSQKVESLYLTLTDKNTSITDKIGKIVKDPTVLMLGWVLFLFWVFWSDSKYTNSFIKRLGWIVWAWVFWKSIWNKIWVDEIIEDVSSSTKSWILKDLWENIKKGAVKWGAWTKKFFETTFPETFSSISDGLWEQFANTISAISKYNDWLKWASDTKKYYIEEDKLWVLVWDLLWDEKFLNTSKSDLQNINSKQSLNPYIKDKTKKALNDANIWDSQINSFVQKHLFSNSFKPNDEQVSDIILTQTMKDSLRDIITNDSDKIINTNTKLDKEIKKDLAWLINSTKPEIKNIWKHLRNSLNSWELDEFKLENFPSIKPADKNKIQSLIKKFKYILAWEKYIGKQIEKIENISIISNWDYSDTKQTLEQKLALLEKSSLESSKIQTYDFSIDNFEDAKSRKKQEILKAAKALSIATLSLAWVQIDINAQVKNLDKQAKIIEDKETLNQIELSDIPSVDKTPIDFKKWYENNEEKIKRAEEILEKYKNASWTNQETTVKNIAQEILSKYKKNDTLWIESWLFQSNYEKVKEKYSQKITKLNWEISSVNVSQTALFSKSKTKLEEIKQKYNDLLPWIIWITINDIQQQSKNIFNQLFTTLIDVEVSSDAFVYLDDKLESSSPNLKTSQLLDSIKTQIKKLEQNYSVQVDLSNIEPNNTQEIKTIIENIKQNHLLVSNFENDDVIEEKVEKIREQVQKIVRKYISYINSQNSLEWLKKAKTNYDENVDVLWTYTNSQPWILNSISSMFEDSAIEIAYEEKLKELNPKIQQSIKTNPELKQKLVDWGVLWFFQKYSSIWVIDNINKKMWETTKLIELKNNLEIVRKMYENDNSQTQLITDIDLILEQINNYIK